MVLHKQPSFPASRSFVLKLHRDAVPGTGKLVGRLESVASGEQFEFASEQELLDCVARALTASNNV